MHDERRSQRSTAELIAQLEESRRSLMDAITGLDEEGFRARSASGGWTSAEVLAHLLATERTSLGRARRVLTEDNPTIEWISDDDLDQQARSAQRMPVPQIVHGLLAQRRDVVTLLETLSPQQLSRPYKQERRGQLTAGWLFRRIAEHEDEHAEQIRALRGQSAMREP